MGISDRVLLYGVPGTGKTHQAVLTNLPINKQVFQTTLTADSSATELVGHYIPDGDGGFEWNDGIGMKAWRTGGRLVINEIDHAGIDVMSVLYAILDDPSVAKFTLPNQSKETVKPKKGFEVIATMNGVPHDLPEAIADRFSVKINIDTVHPEAIESLPENLQYAYSKNLAEDEIPMSIRAWKAFAKLSETLPVSEAAEIVFHPDEVEYVVQALELQDV